MSIRESRMTDAEVPPERWRWKLASVAIAIALLAVSAWWFLAFWLLSESYRG